MQQRDRVHPSEGQSCEYRFITKAEYNSKYSNHLDEMKLMQLRYILLCLIFFATLSLPAFAQDELPDALSVIQQAIDDQSLNLNLIARGMDTLPPELFTLTWLETLTIGNRSSWIRLDDYVKGPDNTFWQIPADINRLQRLELLEIVDVDLDELPPEIGQLGNLQTLILWDTNLEQLPPEIADLVNLRSLNLRGNRLTELPDDFTQLVNLEQLDLGRNLLTEVPAELWEMPSLKLVRLDNNTITAEEFERFDRHLKGETVSPTFIAALLFAVVVGIVMSLIIYRRMSVR